MAKKLNGYPIPESPIKDAMVKLMDKFYDACGSTRLGVIKFIRGTHENFYYDYLKNETGKWPSVNDKVWESFDIYEFIYRAYMGSQTAGRNLLKRNKLI